MIAAIFGAKRLSRWMFPIARRDRARGARPGTTGSGRSRAGAMCPAGKSSRRPPGGSPPRPHRGARADAHSLAATSSARPTRSARTCPRAVACSAFRISRIRSGSPPTRHSLATRIVMRRFRPRRSWPRYDETRSGSSCSRRTGSSSSAAGPRSPSKRQHEQRERRAGRGSARARRSRRARTRRCSGRTTPARARALPRPRAMRQARAGARTERARRGTAARRSG